MPNSVRNSAPVGQTSRQAAWVQCLHTSEDISQRMSPPLPPSTVSCAVAPPGTPAPCGWVSPDCPSTSGSWVRPSGAGRVCSTKATWRQVEAPRAPVLSYDMPVRVMPSSGMAFHSLHATSHALQPMHTEVSVKKPTRSCPESGSMPSGTPRPPLARVLGVPTGSLTSVIS